MSRILPNTWDRLPGTLYELAYRSAQLIDDGQGRCCNGVMRLRRVTALLVLLGCQSSFARNAEAGTANPLTVPLESPMPNLSK